MKTSELITLLQEAMDKYGDLEVWSPDEQDENGDDAHLFQLGWKISEPKNEKQDFIYLYPTWYN